MEDYPAESAAFENGDAIEEDDSIGDPMEEGDLSSRAITAGTSDAATGRLNK
jgi:hypothetical protein